LSILITGSNGFVAEYLIKELKYESKGIIGIDVQDHSRISDIEYYKVDITKRNEIFSILEKSNIEEIYHLAAFSNPTLSNKYPDKTIEINLLGFTHLLEFLRLHKETKLLSIGSQLEYDMKDNGIAIKETDALTSKCIYSASKICSEILGLEYQKQYSCHVVFTRSFNHTGAGQPEIYAISSFAKQIAEIKLGLRTAKLEVGNIDVFRDIIDVRDVVKAYISLMRDGLSGEIYNVCRGEALKLRDIINELVNLAELDGIEVNIDPSKYRRNDITKVYGDNKKIVTQTGWTPKYSTRETLSNILKYWILELTK